MWNPFVSFKYDRKSDGVAFFGIPSSPFPCHSDTPYTYPLHSLHFYTLYFLDDSYHLIILLHLNTVLCVRCCVQLLSSVTSDSLWFCGLQPTRPLCLWNFLERILEWVDISYSRGSSKLRDWIHVPCISCFGRQILYHCTTWESRLNTAAAKSLQSCPTLCDLIDGSPPGSAVPGILHTRTLEWVAVSFSNAWKWKVKVKSLSCVWPLATL